MRRQAQEARFGFRLARTIRTLPGKGGKLVQPDEKHPGKRQPDAPKEQAYQHGAPMYWAIISGEGKRFISWGGGVNRIWNVEKWKEEFSFPANYMYCLNLSGPFLGIHGGNELGIWDFSNEGEQIAKLQLPTAPLRWACVAADGKTGALAAGNEVFLFHMASRNASSPLLLRPTVPIHKLAGQTAWPATFLADNKTLAFSDAGVIKLWDVGAQKIAE